MISCHPKAGVYKMYRALKNSQGEITECLMKFADEVEKVSEMRNSPGIIEKLIEVQDKQFQLVLDSLVKVNNNLEKVLNLLVSHQATLNITSTIPSVHPVSNPIDMVSNTEPLIIQPVKSYLKNVVENKFEKEVEEEVEEEVEGVEVEEWEYKNIKFFRDTNNLVYTNNNGEPGDPIGMYDPIKNSLKKLKPN